MYAVPTLETHLSTSKVYNTMYFKLSCLSFAIHVILYSSFITHFVKLSVLSYIFCAIFGVSLKIMYSVLSFTIHAKLSLSVTTCAVL